MPLKSCTHARLTHRSSGDKIAHNSCRREPIFSFCERLLLLRDIAILSSTKPNSTATAYKNKCENLIFHHSSKIRSSYGSGRGASESFQIILAHPFLLGIPHYLLKIASSDSAGNFLAVKNHIALAVFPDFHFNMIQQLFFVIWGWANLPFLASFERFIAVLLRN